MAITVALVVVGLALSRLVLITLSSPLGGAGLCVLRLDETHQVVLGENLALAINSEEKTVVRSNRRGWTLGRLVIWPRDSYEGVLLGDGVKGDAGESFQFGASAVRVRVIREGIAEVHSIPLD